MQQPKVEVNNKSISFLGLLTLIFITLKLTGYIAWSWWWVLSPLWLPFAAVLAILAVTALVIYIAQRNT